MHERKFVVKANLKPSDRWQLGFVIAGMLTAQKILARESIINAAEGKIESISGVLHEIGCLACFAPEVFDGITTLIKRRGLDNTLLIAKGELTDEAWTIII